MPSSVPPPPTTPPWEAAQQIRLAARRLREIQGEGGSSVSVGSKPHYQPGNVQIDSLSSYQEMKRLREATRKKVEHLREVIPSRKVSEISGAVTSYLLAIERERMYADKAFRAAGQHIDMRSYEAMSYYDKAKTMSGVTANAKAKTLVEQIARLAQCLPTQEHLPSNKHETIIRSIVAILRAHSVEGIEKIVGETANGKDNTDGQKEELGEDGDSAAASIAEALTAVLGTAVSVTDETGTVANTPEPVPVTGSGWKLPAPSPGTSNISTTDLSF